MMATNDTRESVRRPRFEVPEEEPQSVLTLFRRLTEEVATLFRQEVALASAEISRSLSKFVLGVTSAAVGGAVLFAGLLALLASAVLGLANVVEPWLAALIVGLVVGVTGAVMMGMARRKLDPAALKPRRSPESLKRDKAVLMRASS